MKYFLVVESIDAVSIMPTLVFVLVTTYTPGPNNILSGSLGALYGYRQTLPFLLGVSCGFMILMTLCVVLSAALSRVFPSVVPVLRVVGAGYILWLAYSVYRSSNQPKDAEHTRPLGFRAAFALQFVNPKAVFFGMTVATVFLAPILTTPSAALIPPVLAAVTFSAVSTWALAGHVIRRLLITPRRRKLFAIVLSAALIYTAIDILDVGTWLGSR